VDKTVLCTGNYIRKKPFHLFAQKIGKTARRKARISCSRNGNDIFLPFFADTPKGCRLWIAFAVRLGAGKGLGRPPQARLAGGPFAKRLTIRSAVRAPRAKGN
jgi:hypothetical protein